MKKISFRNDILPLKNELFRLALRITLNRADAEDVVQETMLKVWNRREQWHELENLEAFCLTICRNMALDKLKRAGHQNASLDEESRQRPDNSYNADPERQTIENDQILLVRQLMNELPEKQRACMHLRDIEGKAYKEIAQVLDITEQQVKVNIHRARQTIRQRFLETEQYGL